MPRPPDDRTLATLKAVGGAGSWLDSPTELAPYLVDLRKLYRGATPLLLLPASVAHVAQIMAICHQEDAAVVPHGGNTGYCGGATPDESGTQIIVSLQRMRRIRQVDAGNDSFIAEAGVTLAQAREAARAAQRLFPLSLGSEGSAQIGGIISTNAGGTAVLRYGMMRDLVLGLEVVLADGRVLSGLQGLRKDNTGYDLKSLFIGAEGSLGIVTAACLKMLPEPAVSVTALVALDSPQQALDLLTRLRAQTADQVSTFELMPRFAVELAVRHVAGVLDPRQMGTAWYVLLELTSPDSLRPLEPPLIALLQQFADEGHRIDATIAHSLAQARAMWLLRESIPAAQRVHGGSLKHDISVPLSKIPMLIEAGRALIERLVPEGDMLAYGHAGDGNLHFNVSAKPDSDASAFVSRGPALEQAMFDLVQSLGGSISAEHGIGRLKCAEFARRADPGEYAVMRIIKDTLDPKGILNPGKVLCAG